MLRMLQHKYKETLNMVRIKTNVLSKLMITRFDTIIRP